ncbi:MAG: hypothetical protein R3325_04590 [Thermoanaerobaculia bacterium]|nr:hypothetical protein [Thermoanaerobaculia bacterium]
MKPQSYSVIEQLTAERTTLLRALLALVVISITFWLTLTAAGIPSNWEAVFLIVIGYYFKDRPAEDRAFLAQRSDDAAAMGELLWQLALATVLMIGAAASFVGPPFKSEIDGSWIGAVVLAVGFYFKDVKASSGKTVDRHRRYRAIIAILVVGLTLPIVFAAHAAGSPTVPVQWGGVVFVVVAFYFKDKALSTADAPSPERVAADGDDPGRSPGASGPAAGG